MHQTILLQSLQRLDQKLYSVYDNLDRHAACAKGNLEQFEKVLFSLFGIGMSGKRTKGEIQFT
jgi:predicted component of type VI protein secretion system